MTHPHYGRSHVHPIGQPTNIRRSDGAPEPDGALKVVARKPVDTSGRIYDDFLRLLFLHGHREASALANDIPRNLVTFVFFALLV